MELGFAAAIAILTSLFAFALDIFVLGKEDTWREKYGLQTDLPFTGPLSFSHLPYSLCLEQEEALFDIAILGIPFDTSVTYRPGSVLCCSTF